MVGITSTAAPCMCLTDRLPDCDGHLSADSLLDNKRPRDSVQGTTGTAHSQISFGRTDGAEFSPHVSFLPPSTIPELPPQRAGTCFVPQNLIKASFIKKTTRMKGEEGVREPGGFLQVPNHPAQTRAHWPGHKRFHISSAKTGLDQLVPLIFVSCLTPRKDSSKQISVLSGTLWLYHTAGKANWRIRAGKLFQCSVYGDKS